MKNETQAAFLYAVSIRCAEITGALDFACPLANHHAKCQRPQIPGFWTKDSEVPVGFFDSLCLLSLTGGLGGEYVFWSAEIALSRLLTIDCPTVGPKGT